jgi:glycosyltransferase involved in cell wall biosynthesis
MSETQRVPVILVVHDLAGGGGMETVLRRQLPQIARRFDLTVVSCSMDPELVPAVTWSQVRVPTRLAWLKTLSFWFVGGLRVRSLTRRSRRTAPLVWTIGGIIPQRVDAISVHFCHAGYVDQVGWTVGVKGLRRANATWSRFVSLALERHSYRPGRVRRLLAVSGGLRDELERHYPDVPIVLTPNGVDVPASSRIVRSSRQSTEPLRLLFVGGDWARKGLRTVIQAVSRVEGVSLSVVGKGPDALGPALAEKLRVSNRVTFRPWTDDIGQHYEAADALVLASHYETFGMVVFEAAAHGLVPITTPVHGATDLVIDGVSGFVVQPGDVPGLAGILVRLRDDNETVTRVGEGARARVGRFTWAASLERLEAELALLWSQQPWRAT